MPNRKDLNVLSAASRQALRALLDQYIALPTKNPVQEHRAAGMDMALMIHDQGFLTWHQHFIAELETWLVNNAGARFVPLPAWDPAKPVPAELDNGNTSVFMPLPAALRPANLRKFKSYSSLNKKVLPYHAAVHDGLGGAMPDPMNSPSDPIFWPFHAFLLGVFERWRNL